MSSYNAPVEKKPKFSVAISTPTYQNLIRNTLADPERAKRFIASITSAVAVNPQLQECETSTIVAGALLGESLNLSPSPQLGQFYLVPFKQKAKYDRTRLADEIKQYPKVRLMSPTDDFDDIDNIQVVPIEDKHRVILAELGRLDLQAVRPLRAIAAGTATETDRKKLAEIEEQAAQLRQELANITAE